MPRLHTTPGIVECIRLVINNATDTVCLISPYLSLLSKQLIDDIKAAAARNVKIAIVFRETNRIHPHEATKLAELTDVTFFFNRNLHAKAYFNEAEAIVTSFNISGYAEKNNIELGISFDKLNDEELFRDLITNSTSIIRSSKHVTFYRKNFSLEDITNGIFDATAYCIRCRMQIEFNYKAPLCMTCYAKWADHRNYNYQEHYCHFCGNRKYTTYTSPICDDCYADLELIMP